MCLVVCALIDPVLFRFHSMLPNSFCKGRRSGSLDPGAEETQISQVQLMKGGEASESLRIRAGKSCHQEEQTRHAAFRDR